MQQHGDETRRCDRRSKLEYSDIGAPVCHHGHEEYHQALIYRLQHHQPKVMRSIRQSKASMTIKLRFRVQQVLRHTLVIDSDRHRRQRRKEQVVEHQVHLIDHDGTRESAIQLEPEDQENTSLKETGNDSKSLSNLNHLNLRHSCRRNRESSSPADRNSRNRGSTTDSRGT